MITAMDDEVGRVVDALVKKRMRDDTLIVFQSDNGGNRSAMFAGEIDVSKLKLPSDNGPYREGKGTLFEGGTRVVAVANWPGHIKPGPVNEMMHVVDMYPTLTKLAHVPSGDGKPVDGMDVWATISEGAPSPRTEVVYNVEPFRAAIRQGDWKLIWRTPLPGDIMLFDLRQDPSESNDLAARHPEKVAELQERAKELARQSAKPLFLLEQSRAMKRHAPPMLPNEDAYFNAEP
jgi:arylsulfatase A-like enzyme